MLGVEKVRESLPATYFDEIYERSADPWSFASSAYEAAKYKETLACLPRTLYTNGLEVGCSIGVLTGQIALRCTALLAVDVSSRALQSAKQRCAGLGNVRFACMELPGTMPDGSFDLVVVSEVGYYWKQTDLELAITLLSQRQPRGGHLILVHFTPAVADYPLTGDAVHELWLARPEWSLLYQRRHETYRLDVLQRS